MVIAECSGCNQEKKLHNSKLCNNCYAKEWYSKNDADRKIRRKSYNEWLKKNPDYHKKYYLENKERMKATARKHYELNKQKKKDVIE